MGSIKKNGLTLPDELLEQLKEKFQLVIGCIKVLVLIASFSILGLSKFMF